MNDASRREIMALDPEEDLPEAAVSLDAVRSGLDSDDPRVRTQAAKVAAVLAREDGERAAPLATDLATVLDDERDVVVFQSTLALAGVAVADPERVEPAVGGLVALLDHEFSDVRESAACALGSVVADRPEFFVDHAPGLLAAAAREPETVLDPENEPEAGRNPPTVQSPTQSVNREKFVQGKLARETAANLVTEAAEQDPGALAPHVDDLVALLSDPDLGVATAAAAALGSVAAENPAAVADAVDPLADLLDERDASLVATAVRTLGFAGDPVVVDDLRDLAAAEDRDDDLRDLAAETADFLAAR